MSAFSKTSTEYLDRQRQVPSFSVIDDQAWKMCYFFSVLKLSVDDLEPVDEKTKKLVLERFSSSPMIADAGARLFTIPKGLKFSMLKVFSEAQGARPIITDDFLDEKYLLKSRKYAQIVVEKSYRILLTDRPIRGSEKLSEEEQQSLAKELGWEIPSVLEVAACAFLNSLQSCFQQDIHYDTRCSDRIRDEETGNLDRVVFRNFKVGARKSGCPGIGIHLMLKI
jgi:hypothetical protein